MIQICFCTALTIWHLCGQLQVFRDVFVIHLQTIRYLYYLAVWLFLGLSVQLLFFFGRSYMFLSDILRSSIAVVSIQALLSHAANGHRPETTLTRKDTHSQPLQACVYIYWMKLHKYRWILDDIQWMWVTCY